MTAHELAAGRDVTSPLCQFRCLGCGYGASCRIAPERCPMCSGTVWDYESWKPFTKRVSDGDD